jgi:hypothetical protein
MAPVSSLNPEDTSMNEPLQRRADRVIWAAAIAFLMTFGWYEVRAAEAPSSPASPSALDVYRAECGACHVAYPPRLLPPASWQAIMRGLDKHFGVDASLDASTSASVSAFLEQATAPDRRETRATPTVPLRITETPWFRHEHDEIPPTVWQRKSIGSPANCAACHVGAEQGQFSEHTVRIPN